MRNFRITCRGRNLPNIYPAARSPDSDRIEWHTIPDPATAAAALQAGEVDWWEQPTPDLLPLFTGGDVKIEIKDKSGNLGLLRLNFHQKPFDNPKIRHIILSSIKQSDFESAAAGEDPKMWRVPVGFFHPDSAMASTEGLDIHAGCRLRKDQGRSQGGRVQRRTRRHDVDRGLSDDQRLERGRRRSFPQDRPQRRSPGPGLGNRFGAHEEQGKSRRRRLEFHLQFHCSAQHL